MHPAEEFLKALDPTAERFLFIGINQAGTVRPFLGKFDAKLLHGLNNSKNKYEIYVTVNKTISGNRSLKQFTCARALWQEDDSNGTALVPNFPSDCVIETSPGHYHRYWFTTLKVTPESRIQWDSAMGLMVSKYGSDPQAKDLARILRLPGFYNWKRECEVTLTHLEHNNHSFEDLCQWLFELSPEQVSSSTTDTERTSKRGADGTQLEEWIKQIQTGEHLHGPIRSLMLIYANNGMDKVLNRITCLALIHQCPDEVRRTQAIRDLEAMLEATYKKTEAEDKPVAADSLADRPINYGMPDIAWPPGYLGELAKAVYDYSVLPNKTVSIVTAIGLIAGIAGRKYNVSKTGVNQYLTLLMNTGTGKDVIQKFCGVVLRRLASHGDSGMSFLGGSMYTAAKPLRRDLLTRPSLLCILTEAGLINKSDAGDKNSLLKLILDVYTKSGAEDVLLSEGYSSKEDSHPTLLAPALSMISEGTPSTFKETLAKRQFLSSGEFARQWIFEVKEPRPFENRNHGNLNMSQELWDKLSLLINLCYAEQRQEAPKVIEIATPEGYYEFSDWCTTRIREFVNNGDEDAATIHTRAAFKVVKIAALCAILDSLPTEMDFLANEPPNPVILESHWKWAIDLFHYEQQLLPRLLRVEQPMDQAVTQAIRIIHKLLTDPKCETNPSTKSTVPFRQFGIFLESPFNYFAIGNKAIQAFSTQAFATKQMSGTKRVLETMVSEGYLEKVSNEQLQKKAKMNKGSSNSVGYKITRLLIDLAPNLLEKVS